MLEAGHVDVDGAGTGEGANGQAGWLLCRTLVVSMHLIWLFEKGCISVSWRPSPDPLQQRSPSAAKCWASRGRQSFGREAAGLPSVANCVSEWRWQLTCCQLACGMSHRTKGQPWLSAFHFPGMLFREDPVSCLWHARRGIAQHARNLASCLGA